MSKLPYKVECKSTYEFFETIAAFDCQQAAFAYAQRCASGNLRSDYRVMNGRKVLADANACRPGYVAAKG